MKNRYLVGLFVGTLLFTPWLFAEEAKSDADEAKEAEEEEKAAAKLDGEIQSPLKGINIKGVFLAQPSTEEKPAVIGTFKNEKQTFLVKPENDEVRKQLLQFTGKTMLLFAKERNRGKYLVVMNIVDEPDATINRRKKKGF